MKQDYSFWVSIRKALVSIILVSLPIILQVTPEEWLNMTLGGALVALLNFVKYNYLK